MTTEKIETTNIIPGNRIECNAADIQYIPQHRCPVCNAKPRVYRNGNWQVHFIGYSDSYLRNWTQHLVYVQFNCEHYNPDVGGMRCALLGEAIIPLEFAGYEAFESFGWSADVVNAQRVSQGVDFLAKNADLSRIQSMDPVKNLMAAVAAGQMGPGNAAEMLEVLLDQENRSSINLHQILTQRQMEFVNQEASATPNLFEF